MNRLSAETSPYLLQHAGNPVDWYPWGTEALERARRENKPILLSIGYAACHWCHVMERESFEDAETAALMNELFINIKVDREERPDLDSIYMQAVQAMTGHGGWPMTVFLTPNAEPFYGGTYFPPTDRHGLPSFQRVLHAIADAYANDDRAVASTVAQLRRIYDATAQRPEHDTSLARRSLDLAYRGFAQTFDERHAGFGGAPKFPPSMGLRFVLRYWARTGEPAALDMVARTVRAIATGGIYDQIGGGIHRYSVDARWLVPHFEKMLYDNALFAHLAVEVWQATHDAFHRDAAEGTIDWMAREMTAPAGGFFSSLDADSEGHEGKFYVWDARDLDQLLGADAEVAKAYWGVTPGGDFEGANILHVPDGAPVVAARLGGSADGVRDTIARAKTALYEARARRQWPMRDEKILAAWNGLALRAVALAARVFDRGDYRQLAEQTGAFLRDRMVRQGVVVRSVKDERAQRVGFLEDHAAVGLAFLELSALTGDPAWFRLADQITESTVARFYDPERRLFFDTPTDHEPLLTRPRDVSDNAVPSGTSLVAELLARVDALDDRPAYREMAAETVRAVGDGLARFPAAFGHLLTVADELVNHSTQIVIVGETSARLALERVACETFVPGVTYLAAEAATANQVALGRGRSADNGGAARAFVCTGFACDAPTSDPGVLSNQLRGLWRPTPERVVT
jgi:uncharacterized protein YyaL (SSP411 family)